MKLQKDYQTKEDEIGATCYPHKILVEKPKWKRPFRRPRPGR
jgi:hypothetical protein